MKQLNLFNDKYLRFVNGESSTFDEEDDELDNDLDDEEDEE